MLRSRERMSRVISVMAGKNRKDSIFITLLMIGCAAFALPLAAQRQGPLPPPPPGTVAPSTPAGKRYEKVIEAPASSIQRITMEQQDFDDIEKIWPLVLTPEELPKYDIKYIGREQVDELGTYVFDIDPKKLEKNQRYFQGRIWVEDRDMQIVKTRGKGTGLMKKKQDSAFPLFETFRENIEGHYWFPTYTRYEDTLRFKTGPDVRIHVAVRYTNYKRFGSTIKIGTATQVDPEKP